MWHTNRGDRTIRGAEADLLGASIDVMLEELSLGFDDGWEEDPSWESQTGVLLFDSFTAPQRIALLHEVALYLLTDTASVRHPSADTEATVAAIFTEIRDQVAIEIDLFPDVAEELERVLPGAKTWRQRVLAAVDHVRNLADGDDPSEPEDSLTRLPDDGCADIDVWEQQVEYLADSILWDRDFELAETFLDADPGISEQRRRLLGIHDDYFTRVSPDPRPTELPGLISQTRMLVRAKPR